LLELLDALEGESQAAADERWRQLLRWADEQAHPFERSTVWQRRALLLARREQIVDADDASTRHVLVVGNPGTPRASR
jgi:hypothetical protein